MQSHVFYKFFPENLKLSKIIMRSDEIPSEKFTSNTNYASKFSMVEYFSEEHHHGAN